MFGRIYLEQTQQGYAITDVYCEHTFTDEDFGGAKTFGPMLSPNSGNILNTEHTWPQSHFTGSFPKEMQKSDLHHLFPTDSKMNGVRGNYKFGNVLKPKPGLKCPISKLGTTEKGVVFEVPMKQRGNSARAIFYFSLRYKVPISAQEETALREWNAQDPIDQDEIDHNEIIKEVQGNRNPFIDMPDLVERINNFSSTTY
jgi:endonuclease I